MQASRQLVPLTLLLALGCCNIAEQAREVLVRERVRQEIEQQNKVAESSYRNAEDVRSRLANRKHELQLEIRTSIHEIAAEEVRTQQTEADLETLGASVDKQRAEVARLKSLLETSNEIFELDGHRYSRETAAEDLANRFDRLRAIEATQSVYKRQLEARRSALDAARERLQLMMEEVEAVEFQIAAEMPRPVEELVDLSAAEYQSEVAETQSDASDITQEIRDYFSEQCTTAED